MVTEVNLRPNKKPVKQECSRRSGESASQASPQLVEESDSDGSDCVYVASSRAKLNRKGNSTLVLSLKQNDGRFTIIFVKASFRCRSMSTVVGIDTLPTIE